MKHLKWGQYLLLGSIFLLSSCLKETIDDLSGIKGIKVSNSFSAPLIDATMGMKEIYESYSNKAFIREAPDHLLIFTYNSGDTLAPKQFVDLPAIPFDYVLQMPAPVIMQFENQGNIDFTVDQLLTLPTTNKEKVKLVNVKQGTFSVDVVNSYRHNATIILTYPSVTKNGQPLVDTVRSFYNPGNFPALIHHTTDLQGYAIDLSNGGTTFNTVPLKYLISLVNTGNATSTNDFLSVHQNFDISTYNYIVGYLGKFEVLNTSQSQEVDLFDKQSSGKIFVNDPKIVIKVYNTFGIPVTGTINNVKVTTASGFEFPVTIDPFKDTFSFANPTVIGQVAVSEYIIDKTNSNIDAAINTSPTFVKFDMNFTANYNEVEADNFLEDTASFVTASNLEIPLDLKIVDYVANQEERPKDSDTSGLKYVKEAKLSIRTENTLPFDLFAQMIFTRDTIINGVRTSYVTDSLFYPELPVNGAVVDGNGQVIASTVTFSSVTVDISRYERIQRSQNYMLRIRAQSSAFGGARSFVKIYSTQKLNMKIGADVKLTYKSNE